VRAIRPSVTTGISLVQSGVATFSGAEIGIIKKGPWIELRKPGSEHLEWRKTGITTDPAHGRGPPSGEHTLGAPRARHVPPRHHL
jgi:hypothetical protein